jgi:hypothetical protein
MIIYMNNKLNIKTMRKFKNTGEVVLVTFQVGLTSLFVAGALRVLYAIVTGGITDATFGMMG